MKDCINRHERERVKRKLCKIVNYPFYPGYSFPEKASYLPTLLLPETERGPPGTQDSSYDNTVKSVV